MVYFSEKRTKFLGFIAILGIGILSASILGTQEIFQSIDATKGEGVPTSQYGSATKDLVCGDRLCSEVPTQRTAISAEQKQTTISNVLSTQKIIGSYKITVDWLREIPVTDESNGIEVLVTDTSIKVPMMGGGGCGGGDHGSSGHDKGDDHAKGMGGSHDKGDDHAKGMGGSHDKGDDHECPHFKMVKSTIPRVELHVGGVSELEKNLEVILTVKNKSITLPLTADPNLPGRYYSLFIPGVAENYGVQLKGNLGIHEVSSFFELDEVIDKESLLKFPCMVAGELKEC